MSAPKSIHMPAHMSTHTSIHMSAHMSAHMPARMSTHMLMHMSAQMSAQMSAHMSQADEHRGDGSGAVVTLKYTSAAGVLLFHPPITQIPL